MLFDSQFRELVNGQWRGPLAASLRGVLAIGELGYGAVVRRRNARFDRVIAEIHRVTAPVISVGNLTVGGTGKTPFVAWLAKWFLDHGTNVSIISRGYGACGGAPNDEALELAARLPGVPHLQNRDRVAAAQTALAANPRQILILDDAFQHRRLARSLDIVLLDALAPFGYGHLLPRGLLREPVESLARAQFIGLTRSDAIQEENRRHIESRVRQLAPAAAWLELAHEPTGLRSASGKSLALDALRGKRVAAFCGIGNPAGFRATLEQCGIAVAGWLELPDHCAYDKPQLARLDQWLASQDINCAICTCKDLVKIPRDEIGGKQLWALEIELAISRGRELLEEALNSMTQRLTQ